jgi:hypothetical protein
MARTYSTALLVQALLVMKLICMSGGRTGPTFRKSRDAPSTFSIQPKIPRSRRKNTLPSYLLSVFSVIIPLNRTGLKAANVIFPETILLNTNSFPLRRCSALPSLLPVPDTSADLQQNIHYFRIPLSLLTSRPPLTLQGSILHSLSSPSSQASLFIRGFCSNTFLLP